MREFLFKAKIKFNGTIGSSKWIESYHIRSTRSNHVFLDCYDCYPESVGQYTEFLDKGSKKIFRGDILEWVDVWDVKGGIGVVTWNNNIGAWFVENDKAGIFKYLCNVAKFSIIIDNYFDNPQLLEELGENK